MTPDQKGALLAAEADEMSRHPMTGYALSAPILRQLQQAYVARWLHQQDEETNSDTVRATFNAAMRCIR